MITQWRCSRCDRRTERSREAWNFFGLSFAISTDIIPEIKATTDLWRAEARKAGFEGLYLVAAKSFGISGVAKLGFDAALDFPPHTISPTHKPEIAQGLAEDFQGDIYDYSDSVRESVGRGSAEEKTFPSTILAWDNTARKGKNAFVFARFQLLKYKQWLANSCFRALHDTRLGPSEKFTFVNAWNEWAEGTYLEPDSTYGYGYLEATHSVLKEFDAALAPHLSFEGRARDHEDALIVHLHYVDVWPQILAQIQAIGGFDVYVTCTSAQGIKAVRRDLPQARTMLVENRGRDILPFLEVLRVIAPLGYRAVCKIHGKKTLYRQDGDHLRDTLYEEVLGSAAAVRAAFAETPNLGLVLPKRAILDHDENNMPSNHKGVTRLAKVMGVPFQPFVFPAGSMFWFRPEALQAMCAIEAREFDIELGLSDGTFAHAVERYFALTAAFHGYQITDHTGARVRVDLAA